MTCLAEVTLTPSVTIATSYDSENPTAPYMTGYLSTWGGVIRAGTGFTLADQCSADEVLLGVSVAAVDDHTIDSPQEFNRNSTVFVSMAFEYTPDDMQVLTVFKFRQVSYSDQAVLQFFVWDGWVRDAVMDNEVETVALLLDVPPRPDPALAASVSVYARVGGPSAGTFVAFTGFEAFLL